MDLKHGDGVERLPFFTEERVLLGTHVKGTHSGQAEGKDG